jgi:galactokinase
MEERFMAKIEYVTGFINDSRSGEVFKRLYGERPGVEQKQRERYLDLVNKFCVIFPESSDVELFSTPGRTEVGGNHTDHNGGHILAASVDLDVIAAVSKNDTDSIRVISEGFDEITINTSESEPVECEKYTSIALVKGVCARFKELNYKVGGFQAYVKGDVPNGSGLSSSAAFEVLIATILNHLYNGGMLSDVLIAQIAQYSENNYFGKPCGLMDQTTCSVGGLVTIDFKDFNKPIVEKVDFDFTSCGYTCVIVDTGGNHASLNDDYWALEHEMKSVARALGGKVLRDFNFSYILSKAAFLREKIGNDRALLRAAHFYTDDQRVIDQVKCLRDNNFRGFLDLVTKSGESSWMLCQNCYSPENTVEQGVSIALMVSESILKAKGGAWRVHGGGFAGTIQSFVPNDILDEYCSRMKELFGGECCHELIIRPVGSIKISL